MSGWTAALLSVVAVANPIGLSHAVAWRDRTSPSWRIEMGRTVMGAGIVLALLGLATAPILAIADLTTPTFRLAASVVIGVTGTVWMVRPTPPITAPDTSTPLTLGLTMMLAPGPVFAAMAANSDGGTWAGLVAVAVMVAACATALATPRLPTLVAVWSARLVGAATIAVAVGIGIDSARTV